MKPLSPATDTRRFAASQDLAWLLDLDGPGLALRAANREIQFDGKTYEPALLETPRYQTKSRAAFAPGGLIATRATVRVADALLTIASLAAALLRASAAEFTARLRLVWLDANGEAEPEDAITMLRGKMVSVVRHPGAVTLDLADPVTLLDDRRVLREFDRLDEKPALATTEHPLAGRALPVVFGRHDRLRLHPWELGPETELAAPLAIDDDQAFVVSLTNFPASGVAQIGDELVQFDAVDPLGPALGTVAQPIVRLETPVPHSIGETVRAEPAGGFVWFVADHACESVTDLDAGDEPLAPGTFTAETRDVDGRPVQLLRLDRVPSGSLVAAVQGWPLPAGGAAENPADVLEILLTDPRFGALDPSLLEMASVVQLRSDLAASGYAFARVLTSNARRLGDLIDSAAREAAVWVRSYSPKITLARAEPLPPLSTLASLGDATALEPLASADVLPEPAPLPSALGFVRTEDAAEPPAAPFFHPFEPAPNQTNEANPPIVESLRWLDARSPSALTDLARRLAPTLADARTEARHRFLPAHLPLEPGDAVDLTRDPIALAADGLFVESLETAGPASVWLRLAGPLAGPPCFTAPPDEMGSVVPATFVRTFSGGRRLLVALNAQYVARLSWNGNLALPGELRETPALAFSPPWDPDDGPIALRDPDGAPNADDRLVLAAGDPGAFAPFLFFTADPAFAPPGAPSAAVASATIVENVPLPAPPPALSDCVLADAGGFTFFPHPSAAAFHYDKTTNELRLAAELVEGAPLDGS